MDCNLSLTQYVSIFNFLSKIIYYSCNANMTSLSLRRIKNNELIPSSPMLDEAEEFIERKYEDCRVKFTNLYSIRIDEFITLSLVDCQMRYKDPSKYKYLYPFSICNTVVFSDDTINIFLFIDENFYKGINFTSANCLEGMFLADNNDYFIEMMKSIIINFNNRAALNNFNYLVSNILFKDANADNELNKIIDKILNETCTPNLDYIRIDNFERFREILNEYFGSPIINV